MPEIRRQVFDSGYGGYVKPLTHIGGQLLWSACARKPAPEIAHRGDERYIDAQGVLWYNKHTETNNGARQNEQRIPRDYL